jgi:hypothetical protein
VDTAQERGRVVRRLVAEGDQAIPPDAERVFAQRMRATTTLVPTDHVAMVYHPAEVVTTIETAAAVPTQPNQPDRSARSTGAKYRLANKLGDPASVKTEYAEHGIGLTGANNDREAGYLRLLELLHVAPGRIAPPWAQVPSDVGGTPRLYVSRRCKHLIA